MCAKPFESEIVHLQEGVLSVWERWERAVEEQISGKFWPKASEILTNFANFANILQNMANFSAIFKQKFEL